MSIHSERTIRDEETQPSQIMNMSEGLPYLHTPYHRRRLKLLAGVVLVVLDLCCLPIKYYYALKFDTNCSLQDSMIVPTYNLVHKWPIDR